MNVEMNLTNTVLTNSSVRVAAEGSDGLALVNDNCPGARFQG